MNYEEIENRKKVSKEMEEKLLKTMKQKHLKRLSVAQYINDSFGYTYVSILVYHA